MKSLEKNLKETKKELVALFEGSWPVDDFLYLFRTDGTLDYHHPSYFEELDETNLKIKQTARQLKDFYQSEDWTPEDATYYLIGEIY